MVFSGLRLRVSTAQRIFCELEPLPRRPLNGHNKLVSSGTLPCGPDQVTSLPLFSLYVQGKCVHTYTKWKRTWLEIYAATRSIDKCRAERYTQNPRRVAKVKQKITVNDRCRSRWQAQVKVQVWSGPLFPWIFLPSLVIWSLEATAIKSSQLFTALFSGSRWPK